MCDEFIHAGLIEDTRLSRRTFGLVTAAAAAVSTTAFAQARANEKDVAVKTPDDLPAAQALLSGAHA